MKKKLKKIGIILLLIIIIFLIVRFIGMLINKKVPNGGINESMYININGSKQWINIYGKNKDNPVLLYLHGGPGASTSEFDYAFTRKWSDVYTVVTWDQRNAGKSDIKGKDVIYTKDLFMTDGLEVTKYILDFLKKDKLTILGHSWGSYFGANLVLEYPEYYEAFIGTGQVVDFDLNEQLLYEEALKWTVNDKSGKELLEKFDVSRRIDINYYMARNKLLDKYGYGMMESGTDYNIFSALIFNPNYSLYEHLKLLFSYKSSLKYLDFLKSNEFKKFSLKDRYDYTIPYYNINGDKDYQANCFIAKDYYDKVNAPFKKLYTMKDMTHGLLESRSEEFSKYIHEIAKIQKDTM